MDCSWLVRLGYFLHKLGQEFFFFRTVQGVIEGGELGFFLYEEI
jgi:hypothetical protein